MRNARTVNPEKVIMRFVGGMVRVAVLCFGSVAAGMVGPACAVSPPAYADHDQWTRVSETGTPVDGGCCPRCNEWVKGSPAGWAHGADEAGRPWNWHGYLAKCAKCGANLYAEMDDVEVDGRFTIIRWRLEKNDGIIATAPSPAWGVPGNRRPSRLVRIY